MSNETDAQEQLAKSLAIAFSPETGGDFVSRHEFTATVQRLDQTIDNAILKMRNWVMGGVIATIVTFGSGYVSLVGKIDRLTEAMPIVDKVLDDRRAWMMRKEQTDQRQDQAIKARDPGYEPLPYTEPPA